MATNSFLKQKNMLEIISAIKKNGAITKPEIAKATGLTQSTIHNFTNDLLERKIIVEDGIAESNGGRKATIYRMNAEKFFVIALDIGDSYISICLYNLELKEMYSKSIQYNIHERNVSEGFEDILSMIEDVLKQPGVRKDDILGVGVSISGTVDFASGKIHQITNAPKWRNIPLAKMIEDSTGIKSIIDKDNNNAVLYYKTEDIYKKRNLVFLSTRKGIGTGVLIEGNVYRGNHCMAGELGHIRVDSVGEVCKCGRKGCLEPLASDLGIIRRVERKIRNGEKSVIVGNNITLDMIIGAAQDGDVVARETLDDVSEYLCITISNTIRIYDPDEIIVDCIWLQCFSDIFNSIVDRVYEDNSLLDRESLMITLSTEDNILLLGAAALIIDYHLNSCNSSRFL